MSNSKQMNFFIVPEDWPAINVFLEEVRVNVIKVPLLKIDDLFTKHANDDTKTHQVYLAMEDYHKNIILNPQKGGYYIDILRSNVIEFNRGGFFPISENILHRARLYAVFEFYDDNGITIVKNSDFKEWVNTIFKLFKKTFLHKTDIDKDFLFSEKAIQWMRDNKAHVDKAGLKAHP